MSFLLFHNVVKHRLRQIFYVATTTAHKRVFLGARTTAQADRLVLVEGLFVGVSDEGHNCEKEILIKDTANDNVIAVRDLPESYGTWPNIGYEKGDKVKLYADLIELTYLPETNTMQNKKYLSFSSVNPTDINDTIVSKGNLVTYNLDNVVVLETLEDWIEFFDMNTIQMYTYVRLKSTVCLNYYKATDANGHVPLYRPHMNYNASDVNSIKPDGARAVGFRDTMVQHNVGDAWDNYFDTWDSSTSGSKDNKQAIDIVAIFTSANSINFQLTVLEANWLGEHGLGE